jgi:hypothetical protein
MNLIIFKTFIMGNKNSFIDLTSFETKFGTKIVYGEYLHPNFINFENTLHKFNIICIRKSIECLNLELSRKQNWIYVNENINISYRWSIKNKKTDYIAHMICYKFLSKLYKYDYRHFSKLDLILPKNYKSYSIEEIPQNFKNNKFDKIISLNLPRVYFEGRF